MINKDMQFAIWGYPTALTSKWTSAMRIYTSTNCSCNICNSSFNSFGKLSKHTRDKHKIKSKEYYDTYVKKPNDGLCKYCSSITNFTNINRGYVSICAKCGSQNMKDTRAKLKENPEKFKSFTDKVATNQSRIWTECNQTGESDIIRQKISNTNKKANSLLSKEELRDKYGWLNKLSPEDAQRWITETSNTGMHRWWRTATQEQKQTVINKRQATISQISLQKIIESRERENPYGFILYKKIVKLITEKMYDAHIELIDPNRIRGDNWHLEHKYSIKVGHINNIDPYVIASHHNLEIIEATLNSQKQSKCSITLEELMEKVNGKI